MQPTLAFLLEAEIPLPGPLPGAPLVLRDGLVEVVVAGGAVLTAPTADADPRFVPSDVPYDPATAFTDWVVEPTGRFRFRASEHRIEAQKSCKRCKDGWKRHWKKRVAGSTLAPPVVHDQRVYFGTLDNRVFCLKARNGHIIWYTELEARITSSLVLWSRASTISGVAVAPEHGVILAVPAGGAELIGLDGTTGEPLARMRLPEGTGRLVSLPVPTPDGSLVVARQKYSQSSASLMVYRLSALDTGGPPVPEPAATP